MVGVEWNYEFGVKKVTGERVTDSDSGEARRARHFISARFTPQAVIQWEGPQPRVR